jgi:hypothetical protein
LNNQYNSRSHQQLVGHQRGIPLNWHRQIIVLIALPIFEIISKSIAQCNCCSFLLRPCLDIRLDLNTYLPGVYV